MRALQGMDNLIVERRDRPVVLGTQALEPGFARMDNERRRARRLYRFREGEQSGARLLLVDADPALDRNGDVDRGGHGRYAFGDQLGLAHQASAETAALDPVGRAAAVEIDLVIAELGANARRLG